MAKIITLNRKEFKQLENASIYLQLPVTIANIFSRERISMSNTSRVIDSLFENTWYVIDDQRDFLRIFIIVWIGDYKGEAQVKIIDKSPTKSDRVENYPIYKVGIPFKNAKSLYISGEEREKLKIKDEKQLQKWDYFFRASEEALVSHHLYMIDEFEQSAESYQKKLISNLWKIGGLFLGIIFLLSSLWQAIAIGLSLYGLYYFKNIFFMAFLYHKNRTALKKYTETLEEEKVFLAGQLHQTNISGAKINEWLESEKKELFEEEAKDFGIPKNLLNPLNWKEAAQGHYDKTQNGMLIDEWGILQPITTNGKNSIVKNHWSHLRALRFYQGRPLVGVYYFTFLYVTGETMAITNFFYDFILSKPYGKSTNQYYYKDIVSIGTTIKESKILNDLEELETEQVVFSLYSGEKLAITLTDKVSIQNLRTIIDQRHENQESEIGGFLSNSLEMSDTFELDQLEEMENNLPGTRAKVIVKSVRQDWNGLKNRNLPPNSSSGLLS